MLLVFLLGGLAAGYLMVSGFQAQNAWLAFPNLLAIIVIAVMLGGLFIVHPNEAKALVLFGTYKGTVRKDGFWWANPFLTKQAVSLRVRNFETAKLKVNDNHANPIEIAAIVVWKVVDSAEALFEVDDFARYVEVQSESALRATAVHYAYDSHSDGELSLSQNTDEVSQALEAALVDRLKKAGVEVIEARISHLAYAQEIAAAMLQRQQASAIIAARQKIVEGAVGMVEMALHDLNAKSIVKLDDERKATMVSNLLVVLCSDHSTQPVINTGTLY
ncbi:MAG: SPFH domain-containing protein [Gemmatimonadaceae bacterium]|nr:SPFH domain-containing protein [Gemmatimonadaceae bacterium]